MYALAVGNLDHNETYHLIPECEGIMLACIVADFFKYKVVQSIVVLACWSPAGRYYFLLLKLTDGGSTFSCFFMYIRIEDLVMVRHINKLFCRDSLSRKTPKNYVGKYIKGLKDFFQNILWMMIFL